ncbi:phosphonate C-P lyase system protein PhnG [Roseicitreum antarcticum]|uniref:Alpha-D-ribose 1-methylphosphonate 5-triphosphate synthase subunit PhnG n=1 Tax=Roseicitreum antarcticum TaxID=564137 RepID=A0A1H2UID9_9RHOB|nr:phosphonate C-P lyase system protein PhnG [Roseicitreum antarcticum]SDW55901.1 alpha-D-ribose 1-methylphosphonate 5-triphosphate synthase subunit PhnG [Roseicitreum antarcticum]
MNGIDARKTWMGLLARAPQVALEQAWAALGLDPGYSWLRAPGVGTVMVRGRAGGTGAPFNLGEITVTRASLRLACGTVGHAYVQGRSTAHSTRAALVDALMQTDAAERVRALVLDPLAQAEAAARTGRAAKAAATKVDFFTLVRGEN